jgi:hypothetical protein
MIMKNIQNRPIVSWPLAARVAVSAALGFHCAALLAVALAGAPSSPLERLVAEKFAPYVNLIHQANIHRYYAPAPPPTPVVTADIQFAGGRASHTLRLPDRATRPRLLYQRQLALAFHLYAEFQQAKNAPGGPLRSQWGASYARHLLAVYPESTGVTIRAQQHLIPNLMAHSEHGTDGAHIDPDEPRYFTVPEVVGEYARGHDTITGD